jgi:hypothetical protein
MVKLFQLKARNRLSDGSFKNLLTLLKDRNDLFVNSTDSIVEKTVVMTRTATETEEKSRAKQVFCYFPIISHLKRWFANNESELLRWHKEKHKQDAGMIRHPADITQWQNIDS